MRQLSLDLATPTPVKGEVWTTLPDGIEVRVESRDEYAWDVSPLPLDWYRCRWRIEARDFGRRVG